MSNFGHGVVSRRLRRRGRTRAAAQQKSAIFHALPDSEFYTTEYRWLIGHSKLPGRSSQPRDALPAHVARAALLAPHGGRDGPGDGEHGGGAGLLAAG